MPSIRKSGLPNSQRCLRSSLRPIHRPFFVPTSSTASAITTSAVRYSYEEYPRYADVVGQDLSTTSYALLGLLVFSGPDAPGMTGYELKQRADRTLRFYWVSPAMSQVYSELARLADQGLVTVAFDGPAGRRDRRYRISPTGLERLRSWQARSTPEFPILKHP